MEDYKRTSNTNKHHINILSLLTEKIKYIDDEHKINNSIGKQLGLIQDFKDLVTEINSNRILFPDFYILLKICRRDGWNGRGLKNRSFK